MQFAKRLQSVKPSPTLAVTAKAAALRAEGKDIIGLGAGEPDFDTPDHIKEVAIRAIHDGFTKYTAVDGILGLKAAIIDKFQRDNRLEFQPEQVLVSCGGKQSFFNLAQALLSAGDEVVIPAPYWVSYPDMVLLAEGTPVFIQTNMEQRFKITPEQLDEAMNERTKLVVLNSPSNPSGMAYSKAELQALGEVLRRYPNALIATDDMYEHILWNDEGFHNILDACHDLGERTIVLNGVSKAYAMTGWRIGYAAGPVDLIKKMKMVQSQSTSNPTSIAQIAAEEALIGDQSCVATMLKEYKARHDFVVGELSRMKGVKVIPGDGTFYTFPDFQEAIDNHPDMNNDLDLAAALLEEAGVA
ncbi:MAG: pyridoxal phosphate-dependent aminotransferase, partial [Gammaproteobacteria bacterium]